MDWSSARAMIGVVKSDSIHAQVAHLVSAHEDPWAVPAAKKPLKELVERARSLGGADDAAGAGTAFHGLAEVKDEGRDPEFVPKQLAPWLEARAVALEEFDPVLIEPFIVCDELKAAGNPDRYLLHKPTGIVYAADDKTGSSEPDFPLKVSIQVAIASRGVLYDQKTGKRTPIKCDQDKGLLIHTPIKDKRPRCNLYWLDLKAGWEYAKLAVAVREARKMPKLTRI
ncbi:hypothetical protein [Mycobacteroides abscessus]|uniref:hypothetical protein n=1 Tax=Mycobacteroides abscessus TaxID=36809 RepID=UPI001896571A|nr:hypothetical protein [Mycobacteroides abscessus]